RAPTTDPLPAPSDFSVEVLRVKRLRGLSVEALVAAAGRAGAGRDAACAECLAHLRLDLEGQVGALAEELLRVLAALAEPHIAVREPRARLVDDVVLDAEIDQQAGVADALVVHHVELRLLER